jgi:hypothetical protein
MLHRNLALGRFFGMTYAKKNDMRFGTWNVGSLHRAGSLTTDAREIAKYKIRGQIQQ